MIERLYKRLLKGITILSVVKDLKLLIEGIAVEFYRVIDYKDEVLRSVVPNENMSVDSIEDYNVMLGIPNSLSGTNSEKIARIIEKNYFYGFPGKDWLEGQIRKAGYDLYVIENTVQLTNQRQWNDFQFSESVQFGLTERFLNPVLVPGELIVNQPWGGLGRIYTTQYGPGSLDVYDSMYGSMQFGDYQYGSVNETIIMQYGTDGLQYGTPDLTQTYPRAREYELTIDPMYFGFYFFLSPFPDRTAEVGELLELTVDQYIYLRRLVISSKLVRNYCIAQVVII